MRYFGFALSATVVCGGAALAMVLATAPGVAGSNRVAVAAASNQNPALATARLAMLAPGSKPPVIGPGASKADYLAHARVSALSGKVAEAEADLEWVQLSERADAFYANCEIPALDPQCAGPVCHGLYEMGIGQVKEALASIDLARQLDAQASQAGLQCAAGGTTNQVIRRISDEQPIR